MRNLSNTCENAWSYLQIPCKPYTARVQRNPAMCLALLIQERCTIAPVPERLPGSTVWIKVL